MLEQEAVEYPTDAYSTINDDGELGTREIEERVKNCMETKGQAVNESLEAANSTTYSSTEKCKNDKYGFSSRKNQWHENKSFQAYQQAP